MSKLKLGQRRGCWCNKLFVISLAFIGSSRIRNKLEFEENEHIEVGSREQVLDGTSWL